MSRRKLLSVEQAAKVLGVQPGTVRQHVQLWMVTDGETGLAPAKAWGHLNFEARDVRRWAAVRRLVPRVRDILQRLTTRARRKGVVVAKPPTVVYGCRLAQRMQEKSKRFYAHTFDPDYPPGTICLVAEAERLGLPKLAGILAHEMGHLMCGVQGADAEIAADAWIKDYLDLDILYGPDTLEFLDAADLKVLGLHGN